MKDVRQMYGIIPSYVERRLQEAELADQNLQYEHSFGWVGRTDRRILENSDQYEDYSPQIDYDRVPYHGEFQPRFSPSNKIHGFGLDDSQNDIEAVEGFGDDDLFLDHRQTHDRTSNDYGDLAGNGLVY